MKFRNLLKIAYRSLNKNKLRSFLTMLGIIIGVASVIAMLAIGQGSRNSIHEQIASLGTNVLVVLPGASTSGGVRMEAGTSQKLSEEDARLLLDHCPSVKWVSPLVRTGKQIIAGSENWRSQIYGVKLDYFPIRNATLSSGDLFTESDIKGGSKVCILGQTVVTNLFGEGADPIGQIVRINKIPFRVIGVLNKKGQSSFGQDQDDVVIGPFSTIQKKVIAETYVHQILVSAQSEKATDQATTELKEFFRERHKVPAGGDDTVTIRSQAELSTAAEATAKIMTILLASIASISLLVGGIGIMNIMLVSVTERTREIGIRLAIGAKGSDVLMQFLIEAIMLSIFGGLIGVGLGIFVSSMVSSSMGWPVAISPDSIILAFVFSSGIGIFFGWYPARKAAQLNPIDALRYE